ncbi:MnmC family methyltransferase [Helicobacter sp. 11S03491-1]|uniref:tRNA (5-methylaminomethyl-2-thiouridine)(34)-methyltransferase MnmD n=1 Tax=Helicobacter sp. 11S03491-1 TaxID=1476196 RepID=UPI000BA5677E|nr:MnmC family methyltransferase [Helicobacter sp. 11S03491-1]PAF41878.1 hypothetical protein BKH45_06100 [Helicobacter sp. 11S03491-1]
MDTIISNDGSLTAFNEEFKECYHSLKDGAYTETLYKHVLPPIEYTHLFKQQHLRILDICFGLGYNCFATIAQYLKMSYEGNLQIFSPEKDEDIFKKILSLKYPDALCGIQIPKIIKQLQSKRQAFIGSNIKLEIFLGDAREYLENFKPASIDIVYQDAFSPKTNPELWNETYFKQLFKLTHGQSLITTYSVNATIRHCARNVGFLVYEYKNPYTRKSTLLSKKPLIENENIKLWKNNSTYA